MKVNEDALKCIIQKTQGYPYFLQEWGKHTWDTAKKSPITLRDVEIASTAAIAALDESFFRVRFDRLTPSEKKYLRAMAEIGPGPHRSGDIAEKLGREVTSLGPTRNQLIAKGMIWSPSHGDTAFTVPMFDEFMRRIMPGHDWRSIGRRRAACSRHAACSFRRKCVPRLDPAPRRKRGAGFKTRGVRAPVGRRLR